MALFINRLASKTLRNFSTERCFWIVSVASMGHMSVGWVGVVSFGGAFGRTSIARIGPVSKETSREKEDYWAVYLSSEMIAFYISIRNRNGAIMLIMRRY